MALRETTPEDVAAWINLRLRELILEKQQLAKVKPLTRYQKTVRDQHLRCASIRIQSLTEVKDKVLTIDAVNPK